MAYHFQGTQLRVFQKYSRQKRNLGALSKSRAVLVLHALPTSVEFVKNLKEAGVEISYIFIKPYSIQDKHLKELEKLSKNTEALNYDTFDEEGYKKVISSIEDMIECSAEDKKDIRFRYRRLFT